MLWDLFALLGWERKITPLPMYAPMGHWDFYPM